ncbi:MAG: glycosyltransferase [Desulfobacteraceae bacterium]|nr:MAG: glycosyltransferase [Desulfobacteraceae bacterium]
MKNEFNISLVLGSLNRFEYLKAAIMTVRREIQQIPSSEIIVIDGGSTDGSLEWLIKQKDIILILQHNHGYWNEEKIKKQNWGYYMNLGFKSARYDHILMISDDCLLIRGAIINGLRQINELKRDNTKIGGLAFQWRHWPDWEKYGVAFFYNKAHLNHGIYLKEALMEVGYADEVNYSFYAGDVDLSFKLHEAGLPIMPAESSYLEHCNHVSKSYKRDNYRGQEKEEAVLREKWSKIWGTDYFENNIRWRREVVDYIDPDETFKIFAEIQKKRPLIEKLAKRQAVFRGFLKSVGYPTDALIKPNSVVEGSGKGVLFFPDWSYYNPYQKLLYQTLNELYDISAYGFNPEDFNIECLKKYMTQCKILHLHWINALYKPEDEKSIRSFFKTLHYAKKLGYKILWTVHNLTSHESSNPAKEQEIRRKVSLMADCIFVHGNFARETVGLEYGAADETIYVMPHGHYHGFYKNDISKSDARKQLLIDENDYVFLFFGSIRAYKGLEELVESFIRINANHPATTLLIAGRGLDKQIDAYLKTKTHKKIITRIGFIPDDEVQVFLNASDIMVLPYKNILTSGAALLALSFFMPVIAPSIGLLPELVSDKTGYLFDTHDEMEQIMENCLSSGSEEKFHKDAFLVRLDELSWERILRNKEIRNLYQ